MTTAVETDNRYCLDCERDISHLRADAKCCNATCRKRYNRRRQVMIRHKNNALAAIRNIEALMTDSDLEILGRELLERIAAATDLEAARRAADEAAEIRRAETAAFLESRRAAIRDNGSVDAY